MSARKERWADNRRFRRTIDPQWCECCHQKDCAADSLCEECFMDSHEYIQYLVERNLESLDETRADEQRFERDLGVE